MNYDIQMNNDIPPIFILIPALIVIFILVIIILGLKQWHYNNKQPLLSFSARIVSKRTNVHSSSHYHDDTTYSSSSSDTRYFLTFEFEDSSRKEFEVRGNEYGLLVEGDIGTLKYQGTRYLGFERHIK